MLSYKSTPERDGSRGRHACRGKSGHHRAGRPLTTAGGDLRERATESKPPVGGEIFQPARVKRRGKSPPERRVTGAARQPPPGARPNRLCLRGDNPLQGRPVLFPATERQSGLAARGRRQRRSQMNGCHPERDYRIRLKTRSGVRFFLLHAEGNYSVVGFGLMQQCSAPTQNT